MKTTKLLFAIFLVTLMAGIGYLMGVFVQLSWNIFKWEMGGRVWLCFIGAVMILMGFALVVDILTGDIKIGEDEEDF